jgi:hypothetical protein
MGHSMPSINPDPNSRRKRERDVAHAMKALEAQKRRTTLWVSSGVLVAALGGTVGVFVNVLAQKRQADVSERSLRSTAEAIYDAREISARFEAEIARLRASDTALQESLARALEKGAKIQAGGLTPQERETLSQTAAAASQLDKRMAALETAILQTPEKAVAIPLLRQQLVDLQDRTHRDVDGVRGEIGRLYTMLQWLLGLMVTIIIGIGGLIAASLRQIGEKRRDVPREPEKEVAPVPAK